MQLIGFNFTKIIAEKKEGFKRSNITTNIEFTDIQKEQSNLLKESEIVKVYFKNSIKYGEDKKSVPLGEVLFEGFLVLSVNEDESKNITKSWKKKELPGTFKVALFNIILQKCTAKAIILENEVGLPAHIPLPKIGTKKK